MRSSSLIIRGFTPYAAAIKKALKRPAARQVSMMISPVRYRDKNLFFLVIGWLL